MQLATISNSQFDASLRALDAFPGATHAPRCGAVPVSNL